MGNNELKGMSPRSSAGFEPASDDDSEPPPCAFFNRPKGCKDGEDCPFSHTKPIDKKAQNKDRKNRQQKARKAKSKAKSKATNAD